MQSVVMMGRCAEAPELRHTPSGVAVATWRIAVDRDYRGPDGQRKADFFTVVAWRGLGELAAKHWHKGKPILVRGHMEVRPYSDKEGHKRQAVELIAEDLHFLPRDKGDGQAAEPSCIVTGPDDGDLVF